MRPVGEILADEFAWDPRTIDEALRLQAAAPQSSRRRIGHYLRQAHPGDAQALYQIGLALLLQQHESAVRTSMAGLPSVGELHSAAQPQRRVAEDDDAGVQFDRQEYAEIGTQMRFERQDILRRIRNYAVVMLGVVLYIGYALSAAAENPKPAEGGWEGLFYIYAVMGVAFVGFAVFYGDNVVKAYGEFLKRRTRFALSRLLIRARMIERGATATVMPSRTAHMVKQGKLHMGERPDPEFRGIHRYLVLLYSVWSLLKFGFAVFFVSAFLQRGFHISQGAALSAILVLYFVFPWWTFFISATCVRYHKYLKEARALDVQHPFPRGDTEHLREKSKADSFSFATLYGIGIGLLYICSFLGLVFGFDEPGPGVDFGMLFLIAGGVLAVGIFLLRYKETRIRHQSLKIRCGADTGPILLGPNDPLPAHVVD